MKINQFHVGATVGDSRLTPIQYARLTPDEACQLDQEKFLVFAGHIAEAAERCRMDRRQLILPKYEEILGVCVA